MRYVRIKNFTEVVDKRMRTIYNSTILTNIVKQQRYYK